MPARRARLRQAGWAKPLMNKVPAYGDLMLLAGSFLVVLALFGHLVKSTHPGLI